MQLLNTAWGGWEWGDAPTAVGNWEGEENIGWQLKEETEDESSEVVFTCLGNVGQSPTEVPQITEVLTEPRLPALISSDQ